MYNIEIKKKREEDFCEEKEPYPGLQGYGFKNFSIFCSCEGQLDSTTGSCPGDDAPCPKSISASFQLADTPVVPPIGHPGQYFIPGRTAETKKECEKAAKTYVEGLSCSDRTSVLNEKGARVKMKTQCSLERKEICGNKKKEEEAVVCVPDPSNRNTQICCSGSMSNPQLCEETPS